MAKVILDAATRAKLNGTDKQLELYDEQGNLLGYFVPVDAHLHSVDLPGPDPFSDKEIAEVLKQPDPGRPLADILRDLRNR
jgi:hypothetical protein